MAINWDEITPPEKGIQSQYLLMEWTKQLAASFIKKKGVAKQVLIIHSKTIRMENRIELDLLLSFGKEFGAWITLAATASKEWVWELVKVEFTLLYNATSFAWAVYTPQRGLVVHDPLVFRWHVKQYIFRHRLIAGENWVLLADEAYNQWPLPEEILHYVKLVQGRTQTVCGRRRRVIQAWVREDHLSSVIALGRLQ
jgi:hypothetical protein